MTFGNRFCQALAVFALGALFSAGASGQVTTRFVVPSGAATTTKILPGGIASFDVRIDAPATTTIRAAFRLLQTNPAAPSGFFTITARDFTASIYNDTSSGSSDALVFGLPSALLDPQNDDNLGRNTIGLVGAAAGTNLFVAKYTLTSNAATPLGTYRIQPAAGGASVVTDTSFLDYDMSAALFDVVVGQMLTVTKSGVGRGTVTSDVGAISCGATCSDIYPGSTVTLTAMPDAGVLFLGWTGGGCSGTGPCVVAITAAATVDAQFGFPVDGLTVTRAGSGSGTVTSVPAGINCGATCTAPFPIGTVVTLTAAPDAGSTFGGWSGGGCSGIGTCVVTANAVVAVTATFSLPSFPMTVTKTGIGTGTVTSIPAGIDCGATCAAQFPSGTVVTLTAAADATSIFMGWSGGGCSGIGTCVVTLSAATTVNAQFFAVDYVLTVSLAGTGSGIVSSVPAGIHCPATCSIPAVQGTVFTLTAAPSPGSEFIGWMGGGCSGTGTCVVTIGSNSVVTATFNDTTAPIATITGFPSNPSSTPNPQFTFISNEAGSTFRCQLDGGTQFTCTSPTTVSVGNGPHTFSVIATDLAGNSSAPTTYTWTTAGIIVVSAIPTLNELGLMLLALLVGAAGVFISRRHNARRN